MYWVEKRLEERDELRQRREKVASGTEPIWKSLSEAMKDSIDAFHKAVPYGRFEADEKNHHVYWVRYVEDTPNRNTEKKKVTVTLDAGAGTITAIYKGIDFATRSVKLVVEGGDVCLRNDADNIQSAKAAEYLLDPFLFPDLAENAARRG